MNQVDELKSNYVPKIFVVCDRTDTAPVWGFILRQQGLVVILETSLDKAVDHWSMEMPDLVVIDIDTTHQDPMVLYKKFDRLYGTASSPNVFLHVFMLINAMQN